MTITVTAGVGRVQQWGGSAQEIHPGDVVWIPPGVKHWHGATATNGMSHVAIAEALDGDTKTMLDDTYNRMTKGRTTIFLPKRLSTVRKTDLVVLLHRGKVAAIGSHVCFNLIGFVLILSFV